MIREFDFLVLIVNCQFQLIEVHFSCLFFAIFIKACAFKHVLWFLVCNCGCYDV